MTARTFDPFDVERPVLKLGAHGQWMIGDITDAREERLKSLEAKLIEVGEKSDATIPDVASVVGDLCEAACLHAEGLSALIVDLCDEDKHGADALGAFGLKSIAEFVKAEVLGEASAGEA